MPSKSEPESSEEATSRENLRLFFEVTQRVLQQVLDGIQSQWAIGSQIAMRQTSKILLQLETVKKHAFEEVKGTLQLLKRGLNRHQRKALKQVGLMGDTLKAKLGATTPS